MGTPEAGKRKSSLLIKILDPVGILVEELVLPLLWLGILAIGYGLHAAVLRALQMH